MNILIAGDYELTRRGIQDILREVYAQAEIFEITNIQIPEEQILVRPWNLILLDLIIFNDQVVNMIQQIKKTNQQIPVLVLAGSIQTRQVVQIMKAGSNGLIHKCLATNELTAAVAKVMAGEIYLQSETATNVAIFSCENKPQMVHQKLSSREFEIFKLVALGKSVKEIALDLNLSQKTVSTHLARTRKKTGLNSPVEFARYALRNGIVD